MSQRWICISNRENAKISQQKKQWGVAKRYIKTIINVKKGDTILMYTRQETINKVKMPSSIMGIFEVTSEMFEETNPLFTVPLNMGTEVFPLRIKIKPIEIFLNPIEFKPLISSLSFITNKEMWSGSIRTAMRQIPESDYQKIIKKKRIICA